MGRKSVSSGHRAGKSLLLFFKLPPLKPALFPGQCEPLGYSGCLRNAKRRFLCQQQQQAWATGRRCGSDEGGSGILNCFASKTSSLTRSRCCIASRCMVAAAPSFRHSLPMFSMRLHCTPGASTGGQCHQISCIQAAPVGARCDTRLLASITASKTF